MVDNLETLDDLEEEDGSPTMAIAAIVGAALVAGAVAFVVRRRQEPPPPEPVALAGRGWERARDLAFSEERAQATRDFLVDKVLPELKPALLGILEEVEDMVDDGFHRAEKAIKSLSANVALAVDEGAAPAGCRSFCASVPAHDTSILDREDSHAVSCSSRATPRLAPGRAASSRSLLWPRPGWFPPRPRWLRHPAPCGDGHAGTSPRPRS
jgi:hypothetical protein